MFGPVSPMHLGPQLFIGHIQRVLDELAIKIHDVQRAIRSGGEIDRVEPIVGRGKKLAVCLVVAPTRDKCRAGLLQLAPSYEVGERFANECIAGVRRSECVTSENRQAAHRVVVIGLFRIELPWRRADGINPTRVARLGDD